MKKKIISIASLIIGIALIVIICVYNGSSHKEKENVASNKTEEKVSSKDNKEKNEEKESSKDNEKKEDQAVIEDNATDENNNTEEEQPVQNTENKEDKPLSSTNSQQQTANTTTSTNNVVENKNSNSGVTSNDNNVISSKYKDGTYKGTADGYNGPVTVSVTIASDKITAINVISYEDDDEFFNEAKGVINKIISNQGTNVDVVSGATYSSKGIINASASAINSAKN
ncbi:FMN-binding protein [Clostridium sp. MSJ-8]|uniref:FMN-binding protein n=1 Tax=Clostridium sp. MSJ-8 TaxID=2841510 RepID=UPI001C0EACA0|nr:FMN-binding protein [Clostridium sp. MSJ-8]MBU5488703.1 FMN-binding protein [Clostridium sp. MSJ-8]